MIVTQGYHWMLYHWFGMELTMQDAAQAITEERSWLEAGYILAAIVVAPVYEELIFRGILFPYLSKRVGVTGGVLTVSILFGLIHFHTPSILPLFLLSVVLCLAYWRTGSLWVSIGIHATFNAIGTLAIKLVY
jgi:membrane protease YdiL (CAAX protease family)